MHSSRLVKFAAAAALILGGLAAAAPQVSGAAPSARTANCFWARNVENFTYVDRQTVNLRVSGRRVYQLQFYGSCNDIDYANALRVDTHGFSSICHPNDVDLIVGSPTGPHRCPVRTLRQLTADEIAALPSRQRP